MHTGAQPRDGVSEIKIKALRGTSSAWSARTDTPRSSGCLFFSSLSLGYHRDWLPPRDSRMCQESPKPGFPARGFLARSGYRTDIARSSQCLPFTSDSETNWLKLARTVLNWPNWPRTGQTSLNWPKLALAGSKPPRGRNGGQPAARERREALTSLRAATGRSDLRGVSAS